MSALIGTGGLISALKQITTFPGTMICMINQPSTSASTAIPVNQTTVGADRGMRIILESNATTSYANHRNTGGSPNGSAITYVTRSANTWYAMIARFNSVSDRDLAVAALSSRVTDTTTVNNDLSLHDAFQIGNAVGGMIAEVGVFSGTAVTDAQYNAYAAGTLLVENMTGITLAASLLTIPNGATTLTAETGQTLTISGSVTQGSSHPVSRTVPTTTIACTAGNASAVSPNATITQSGLTTITCTTGVASAACPVAAVATKLMSDFIINNTGTRRSNQAVNYSWFPGGRIGAFAGITAQEGTGTTDANGRFVPGINRATGLLLTCVRNADATVDDVYYEAFA